MGSEIIRKIDSGRKVGNTSMGGRCQQSHFIVLFPLVVLFAQLHEIHCYDFKWLHLKKVVGRSFMSFVEKIYQRGQLGLALFIHILLLLEWPEMASQPAFETVNLILMMQHFTNRILLVALCLCGILCQQNATAQFLGGMDDGHSMFQSPNQPLGQNIYLGGVDDGYALFLASGQLLGQNIYLGGIEDGHTMFAAINQALGQNIFLGGLDDGHTMFAASGQPLGQNIYLGGIDDGNTVSLASNQPLGQNIYLGGVDDGWAFAVGTNLQLLPVTLKSFEAVWLNDEDIRTQWITTTEINTHHFEVERSIDGSSFETVGSVAAAGQSVTHISYNFIDRNVNSHYALRPPYFYYRLKTLDIDGQLSYSAIVVLPNRRERSADMFVVYPNPAEQFITVEFRSGGTFPQHILQLFGSDGKVLMQQQMNNSRETLQLGKYASGTYYLRLINKENKNTQTLKFIIQH